MFHLKSIIGCGSAVFITSLLMNTTLASQTLTNSIEMVLVPIPAGKFNMGSGTDFNDAPVREVTISNAFYMSAYEVTQAQFFEVMDYNPSWLTYEKLQTPVDRVSWFEAVAFCEKLSEIEGKTYRLPTEAEWEYACRAGSDGFWYFGADAEQLSDHAWLQNNSGGYLQPVGLKQPNAWGLYDMYGNAYEWCSDWLDHEAYKTASRVDPMGPAESCNQLGSAAKVARGGNINGKTGINALRTERCSTTARNGWGPSARARAVGFRVVLDHQTQP